MLRRAWSVVLVSLVLALSAGSADAARADKNLSKLQRGARSGAALNDVTSALRKGGFTHDRTSGSHQTWVHPDGPSLVLSPHGGTVKGYQVKQVVDALERLKGPAPGKN